MTREEAKGNLIHAIRWNDIPKKEALEIAIQALKQEPCEDAVSREAVLDIFADNADATRPYSTAWEKIRELPSVNPQPQVGYWIYISKRRLVDETDEGGIYITDYKCTCSECGGDFGFQKMSDAYCKYCGAKMVEPQEGEVEE